MCGGAGWSRATREDPAQSSAGSRSRRAAATRLAAFARRAAPVRSWARVDSANLTAVKEIFDALDRDGTMAGVEAMLLRSHEDLEVRLYFAGGRALRGAAEVRDFFRERQSSGATVHLSPWAYEEHGEEVIVPGSIRVHREDRSIADAQLRWSFHVRAGRIEHLEFASLSNGAPA